VSARLQAPKKRNPFPRPPLPQAGESLRDTALDLFFDKFLFYVIMGSTFLVVAGVEWLGVWLKQPISPWYWTVLGLLLSLLATWRWFKIWPQMLILSQGIRGEREVGRALDELRAIGFSVFHDIPGDGFNVDHVLIGPGGVFAIETKTWSKPAGRKAVIEYDGKQVVVDGMAPDRDPVTQAEASADHVRDTLQRMTNREVLVRPVVLFPGWWVNSKVRDARTWVLNPKALAGFLEKEPARLAREDVALFSDRLTIELSS
jgi:hypothetical protein